MFSIRATLSRVAALLIRMSMRPNSSLTFFMTSRICSRLVTSILIASDLRPIFRISSAVWFECTQPCDSASWASGLSDSSAVFCRSGSSSTRMSVITTSAPLRARVRASWRPRPRDAPVTTATFPVRSNIAPPLLEPDGGPRTGDRTRDDKPLDLGRALPDLVDLRVPEPFLDRVLLDVAVAAEDLDRVGRDLHRDVGREALGHRSLGALEGPALGRHPARTPDEQAGGVDRHRHVGELETDGLVLPQRLAELLAVLRVPQRELVRRARDAQRSRPHAGPGRLERHQRAERARAGIVGVGLAAEPVLERDMAVLEDHLRGVARAHAELLLLAPHLQARRALRHEERRDAGRAFGRVGVGVDHVVVGDAAVGAELLRAVEDVAIAHARGARFHRQRVGA